MDNNMFKAKAANGEPFRKMIFAVRDLVKESNFCFSPDGISLKAMDSARVSLISMFIDQNAFDTYECKTEMMIGINIANFTKILSIAGPEDGIELIGDKNQRSMTIKINTKGRQVQSKLKLIEIDDDPLNLPEPNHEVVITMPSTDLAQICRDLRIFGDSLTVKSTSDSVQFVTNGELGEQVVDYNGYTKLVAPKNTVNSCFHLNYLIIFAKATNLAKTLTFSYSEGEILVLEFTSSIGKIQYNLAPKMDEDDNKSEVGGGSDSD